MHARRDAASYFIERASRVERSSFLSSSFLPPPRHFGNCVDSSFIAYLTCIFSRSDPRSLSFSLPSILLFLFFFFYFLTSLLKCVHLLSMTMYLPLVINRRTQLLLVIFLAPFVNLGFFDLFSPFSTYMKKTTSYRTFVPPILLSFFRDVKKLKRKRDACFPSF